jgi:ATP-binding cassette subfamily B protein
MSYSFDVLYHMWSMSSIFRDGNKILGDIKEMEDILNEGKEEEEGPRLIPVGGQIEFRNASFRLFEDFSLLIRGGESLGIVGHSGSGKTTLAQLILRHYPLSAGQILIDDQDISRVSELQEAIAYVPQEPSLFHRSIFENIAYGSQGDIRKAAHEANALEFIERMPKGFDTVVGERGIKLSGGQRQRIMIARAIAKNAPIIILDEATSALDRKIDLSFKGRTSIIIAHRLSTVVACDRIIVIENGKIMEEGSHTQLLERDGIYAALWKKQSS